MGEKDFKTSVSVFYNSFETTGNLEKVGRLGLINKCRSKQWDSPWSHSGLNSGATTAHISVD